jgi:hypothetical protein
VIICAAKVTKRGDRAAIICTSPEFKLHEGTGNDLILFAYLSYAECLGTIDSLPSRDFLDRIKNNGEILCGSRAHETGFVRKTDSLRKQTTLNEKLQLFKDSSPVLRLHYHPF